MTEGTEQIIRYRTLLTELLFEREAAGGELPDHDESLFVERLDEIWWTLSASEQDIIDRELSQPNVPSVEESRVLVDCEVSEGSQLAPRKVA